MLNKWQLLLSVLCILVNWWCQGLSGHTLTARLPVLSSESCGLISFTAQAHFKHPASYQSFIHLLSQSSKHSPWVRLFTDSIPLSPHSSPMKEGYSQYSHFTDGTVETQGGWISLTAKSKERRDFSLESLGLHPTPTFSKGKTFYLE